MAGGESEDFFNPRRPRNHFEAFPILATTGIPPVGVLDGGFLGALGEAFICREREEVRERDN